MRTRKFAFKINWPLWGSTFGPYIKNENMLRILVTFTVLVYSMLISTINIHSYKPYKTEPKYHLSRKCCFSYLKSKITSRMFDWLLESLLSNISKFPIVLFFCSEDCMINLRYIAQNTLWWNNFRNESLQKPSGNLPLERLVLLYVPWIFSLFPKFQLYLCHTV